MYRAANDWHGAGEYASKVSFMVCGLQKNLPYGTTAIESQLCTSELLNKLRATDSENGFGPDLAVLIYDARGSRDLSGGTIQLLRKLIKKHGAGSATGPSIAASDHLAFRFS